MERHLAAILSADVVGYSRLMGEDEAGTLAALKACREEIFESKAAQYRGRTVKLMGDGILMEFPSVVDAVIFAVEVQKAIAKRTADLPDAQRMVFRIGINVGDIIAEGDDIYGDGVNIAARLEGLAEPGGICVSDYVQRQVAGKIDLTFDHLGQKVAKNIAEPVNVYRIVLDDKAAALVTPIVGGGFKGDRRNLAFSAVAVGLLVAVGGAIWWQPWAPRLPPQRIEERALPLPDKPSIAILPFTNLSDDREQEYFADGVTDDIITDLSKISGMFVIARNSTFVYKGKAVSIEAVGRELGVRYVLEGSVRKANQRVRITAQLVDAATGGHIWAERYDRDFKDIFALQDEVTRKIVHSLAVTLTDDEEKRLIHKYTSSPEAYDYYLQGWEYFHDPTRERNLVAREMQRRAIDFDPEFAAAYALLAFTYSQEWTMGWTQDPRSLETAFELAERAIALDDSLSIGYAILGEAYLWKKEHEKAIAAQERAIALSPGDADQIAGLGGILTWAGRPADTVELVHKAMRLNPMYPIEYSWNLGHANYLLGRYEEAIEVLTRIRDRNPDYLPARAYLAASFNELGWDEKAQAEAAEFRRLSPETPIEAWRHRLPYEDQAVLDHLIGALQEAGLK